MMSKKSAHQTDQHTIKLQAPDASASSRLESAVRSLEHAQERLADEQNKLQPLREDVLAAKEELVRARAEAEAERPRNLGDVTLAPKQMR